MIVLSTEDACLSLLVVRALTGHVAELLTPAAFYRGIGVLVVPCSLLLKFVKLCCRFLVLRVLLLLLIILLYDDWHFCLLFSYDEFTQVGVTFDGSTRGE